MAASYRYTKAMRYAFNEFAAQTVDFTDEKLVAEYDQKQSTNIERERTLVQKLGVKPEHTVIEFGPGTGALSVALAEACRHVFAVDTSQAMLSYLAKSADERQVANVSTHHAGFLSYRHMAEPVDFIVTKFAFHHLPDFWKGIALTRFNAMLKMGGRLYVHDVMFSFAPQDYEREITAWIDEVAASGGWSREEFEVHVNEEYSTFTWILEGLVRAAGFEIVETDYWTPTYGSILCQKVRAK